MGWGLLLPIVALALSAGGAGAQTLPWPGDQPAHVPASAAPAPSAVMPPMLDAPASPPMLGRPQQVPPCVAEFTRLQGEFEKRAAVAKAGNERKVPREELCKLVTSMVAAQTKWAKFTLANSSTCGIPANIVKQLKAASEHMLGVRKQICTAGPAPAPPSLSEALGTSTLKTPEPATSTGGGTLDTLTGNAIR